MSSEDGIVVNDLDAEGIRRIHLVGVGGTGMGSFAGMLKASGYSVTGSDEKLYPPMSDMLQAWGIPVMTPYQPKNLDEAKPDLAIIGNVIRRENPEAAEARARGIRQTSFPAALGSLFLKSRHSVVVAGTHGKTTTSAMMGHVLVSAGRDPSFLVGGVTQNYSCNYRVGSGPHFVVEGDEYDTAYFDKGPKFLHYRPRTAILTSVELDHADIYRNLDHYESAFDAFARLIPPDGELVACAAYPNALRIARACRGQVISYAARPGEDVVFAAANIYLSAEGAHFTVLEHGRAIGEVFLRMGGVHNVENAMAVVAASRALGLAFDEIAAGLSSFGGVKRRQEVRAEIGGVMVIDDFAHHPTAVRSTIEAVHRRHPERRLWAVFEPRSNTSRRNIHQSEYSCSFDGAQRASIKIPEPHDKVPADERLDIPALVEALQARGIDADGASDVASLAKRVSRESQIGDVILVMSNGSFGGFVDKLIEGLRARRELR
jgi:UDP-N-acetylmuramate: L-alanyl-gamma-D-glutamyl-meso-diaminopimelate ligase